MKQTKTYNGGRTGTVTFHPDVKANSAPKVVDSFTDDSGELMYVLANGKQTLADRYNAIWNPVKGEVKPPNYKGINPDSGRKVLY